MFSTSELNLFLKKSIPWISYSNQPSNLNNISDHDLTGLIAAFCSIKQLYAINCDWNAIQFSLGESVEEFTFLCDINSFNYNGFPKFTCRKPQIYFTKLPDFIFDFNLTKDFIEENFSNIQVNLFNYQNNSEEVYLYLIKLWMGSDREKGYKLLSKDVVDVLFDIELELINKAFVFSLLPSVQEVLIRCLDVFDIKTKEFYIQRSLNVSKSHPSLILSDKEAINDNDFKYDREIILNLNTNVNKLMDENIENDIYIKWTKLSQKIPSTIINKIYKRAVFVYNSFAYWLQLYNYSFKLPDDLEVSKAQMSSKISYFWQTKKLFQNMIKKISWFNLCHGLWLKSNSDFNFNYFSLDSFNQNYIFQIDYVKDLKFSYPQTWSLSQIQYLKTFFRTEDLANLINKIVFTYSNKAENVLKIINSSSNDVDIYKTLHSLSSKKEEFNRGLPRVKELSEMKFFDLISNKISSDTKYLDFGGQNGEISFEIAKHLNIANKNQTFVFDVNDWFGTERTGHKELACTFSRCNILPYDDNTFDFITCFMVIHHCFEYSLTLKELFRVLKPGGFILFREHDADSLQTKCLIDIEHSLFEVVEKHDKFSIEALETYYAEYWTKREFINMVGSTTGLKFIENLNYSEPKGVTRYYYSCFKKDLSYVYKPFSLDVYPIDLSLELSRKFYWNDILKKCVQWFKTNNIKFKKDEDIYKSVLTYFFNKNNSKDFPYLKGHDSVFLLNPSDKAVTQLIRDFDFKFKVNYREAINFSCLIESLFYKFYYLLNSKTSFNLEEYFDKLSGQNYVIIDKEKLIDPLNMISKSTGEERNLLVMLLLRYNYMKLGSQGLSIKYENYNFDKSSSSVLEAFGGVFNHYFKIWGSAFPEEKKYLGSIGNFFLLTYDELKGIKTIFVNPPFDETVFTDTFEHVKDLAKMTNGIQWIIVSPDWSDFKALDNFIDYVKKVYNADIKKFKKEDYKYIDRFENKEFGVVDTVHIDFFN